MNITFQTGIQGLFLFCFLLYRLVKYSYERAKLEKRAFIEFYLLSTSMMVTAFFARNLTEDYFKDDAALLFWLLTGVAYSFIARPGKISPERQENS